MESNKQQRQPAKETVTRLFKNPKVKKILGLILILIGLLAFFTPFTPGSWLVFIGLEFLGVRLAFWDKIKNWFKNKQ
ncbi:MAG: hypothetical protein HYT34_00210 [Candidatus Ryanbacteria bacterium]|nr:hypothetical protein [Candidatus Ryanbacteria bacterium]